jgi:hypothetical protein
MSFARPGPSRPRDDGPGHHTLRLVASMTACGAGCRRSGRRPAAEPGASRRDLGVIGNDQPPMRLRGLAAGPYGAGSLPRGGSVAESTRHKPLKSLECLQMPTLLAPRTQFYKDINGLAENRVGIV